MTTSTGNFDLQPANQSNVGVGQWLDVDQTSVTIPAGQAEEIAFTIALPDDVSPGDHLGGIITSQRSGDGTVALDQRLASRIVVSVSGEVHATTTVSDVTVDAPFAWLPFAPIDVTIGYRLENSGNVLIRPISRVSASLGGTAQTQLSEDIDELMPAGTTVEQHQLTLWPSFVHRITVDTVPYTVDGQPGETMETTATVVVIPWGTAAVILLIAGGLIWYLFRARRKQRADTPPPLPTVPRPTGA